MQQPTDDSRPYKQLAWDTAFWGFPVAAMSANVLTTDLVAAAMENCGRDKIRCLYFLAECGKPDNLRLAADAGFSFVGVRVDLERMLFSADAAARKIDCVRDYDKADLDVLKAIARGSHGDTRFFMDSRFDRQKCGQLYALWFEKDAEEHKILVGESAGRAAGYVTCEVEPDGSGRIRLIAVEQTARGRGLGKALISASLQWFASRGVRRVHVVTQACNVAAVRMYESSGFMVRDTRIWFHCWFGQAVGGC
jgi:dTDP-4-amino-4,6-dideoxy-D-galactose acyltransferase